MTRDEWVHEVNQANASGINDYCGKSRLKMREAESHRSGRNSIPIHHKYKVIIQYVGTRYSGWQVQKNHPTVQALLQNALSRLAGSRISVIGASRTDSGVHALGQVAHFFFPEKRTIPDLQKAINAHLPPDVQIMRLKLVDPGFHAQKDVVRKRYEYRIQNSRTLSPFFFGRACHISESLKVSAMEEGAMLFLGKRDFSAVASAKTTVKNRVRKVILSQIIHRGSQIIFRVEARGFLHHMVRNMAGTLIEIGQGKRIPSDITRVLDSRDRKEAGPTAPPEGLYLVRIWY